MAPAAEATTMEAREEAQAQAESQAEAEAEALARGASERRRREAPACVASAADEWSAVSHVHEPRWCPARRGAGSGRCAWSESMWRYITRSLPAWTRVGYEY
jgi:hypothetical protein